MRSKGKGGLDLGEQCGWSLLNAQILSTKSPAANMAPQGNTFQDYADLKTTFSLDRKSVVLMYAFQT